MKAQEIPGERIEDEGSLAKAKLTEDEVLADRIYQLSHRKQFTWENYGLFDSVAYKGLRLGAPAFRGYSLSKLPTLIKQSRARSSPVGKR